MTENERLARIEEQLTALKSALSAADSRMMDAHQRAASETQIKLLSLEKSVSEIALFEQGIQSRVENLEKQVSKRSESETWAFRIVIAFVLLEVMKFFASGGFAVV